MNHAFQEIQQTQVPVSLAMGTFDGVHIGHQKVLSEAVAEARRFSGEAWALTFDPHPLSILHPSKAPNLITPLQHRIELLRQQGIAGVVTLPFTEELARLSPAAFIKEVCHQVPDLNIIVVGDHWRFGHKSRGSTSTLEELGRVHDFEARTVPHVNYTGKPVSSTRIRSAIREGEFDDVRCMLNRSYSITGEVVEGKQRGRTMGVATANIHVKDVVLPPAGVSAVFAEVDGQKRPGVAYISSHPVADGRSPLDLLEVHLFDMAADLYGHELKVFFVRYMRPGRTFESEHSLKEQIGADIEEARELLDQQPVGP